MAGQGTVKQALRRLDNAIRSFAVKAGWATGDYQVYAQVNESWGYIHLLIVSNAFPGSVLEDQWLAGLSHLERELKDDRPLFEALHLTPEPMIRSRREDCTQSVISLLPSRSSSLRLRLSDQREVLETGKR